MLIIDTMLSPIYQTSIGDSLATLAGMGLMVMMDIVHSHAAPNEGNGLASFDGANDCYFYPGKKIYPFLIFMLL